MEDWTETTLVKLSVKELKSLARKSNVNPNSKKAELVKALLNNAKDTAYQSETNEPQLSRRMTRSRVWHASDVTSDYSKDFQAKTVEVESNLNSGVKDSIDDKKIKKKREKVVKDIDTYDTAAMFPLVSSIQLASKPLLEITNKDIEISSQNKHDELRTGATSKRTKRNKAKNTNVPVEVNTEDVFPSDNIGIDVLSSAMQTSLPAESSEQKDCDLNSTFIVEKEGQHLKNGSNTREEVGTSGGQHLTLSVQSDENLFVSNGSNDNNKVKESKENQLDEKCLSVTEDKIGPGKSKRGKKRKPVSSLSTAVSSSGVSEIKENSPTKPESNDFLSNYERINGKNSQQSEKSEQNFQNGSQILSISRKARRKKVGNKESDFDSVTNVMQNIENSRTERTSEITDKLLETSVKEIDKERTISNSDEAYLNGSKKRKGSHRASLENSNEICDSKFLETCQNKSKRKNRSKLKEPSIVNSKDIPVDDEPVSNKENKKELSLEYKSPKTHEERDLVGTSLDNSSGLQRSSRRNRISVKVNTSDSAFRSPSKNQENSNDNVTGNKSALLADGETGENSVQGPIRSSTFILPDAVTTGDIQEMPAQVPRDSTFILSECDGNNSQRRSVRLSPGSSTQESISNKNAPVLGKSIGNRIMEKTYVKRGNEKSIKKDPGSTLKKTITKSTTAGSLFKKKTASKMPDFKKIHQQLFNNMESLSENKKRQLHRAQGLLQSPIIPRCALLSPKPTKAAYQESSPLRKVNGTKTKSPVAPSPLATKLKTPVAARTPAFSKSVPGPSSVNRFGFRRPVKKEEATNIVGRKMPVNIGNKRVQERNLLNGVRVNKRFMLQMQMRQNVKDCEK